MRLPTQPTIRSPLLRRPPEPEQMASNRGNWVERNADGAGLGLSTGSQE
jgi:hypothetical protein